MIGRAGRPRRPWRPLPDARARAVAAAPALVVAAVVVVAVAAPLLLLRLADTSRAQVSDSTVIGVNRLGAATLDIEIGRTTTMLGTVALAPGDTTVGSVEVSNAGSLPLRYRLTVRGSEGPLGDWLSWVTWVESAPCVQDGPARVRKSINDQGRPSATPGTEIAIGPLVLEPGTADVLCIAAHLPLSAPNRVQGTDLSVELLAEAEHAIETEAAPSGDSAP